jgi:uncharacterized protein YkwD
MDRKQAATSAAARNWVAGLAIAALQVGAAHAAGIYKAPPCDAPQMRQAMLEQVNAVRAAGSRCGARSFAAAQPVAWNQQLSSAAQSHSVDMARSNYFDHVSPRGTEVQQRAEAAGYRWRSVGENIAAGQPDVEAAMRAWMASTGHCENIMDPKFTEVAVACVKAPGTTYGVYWTMVLGRR